MESELRRTIRELLGQVERKEKMDQEKLAAVAAALESASHDGPCPCGSGRAFKDCCKLDWVILRDQPAVGAEPGLRAVPDGQEEEEGSKGKDEVEWLIKIGNHPQKGMVIEATSQGMQRPPAMLAEMLLTAYHVTNHNAVVAMVQYLLKEGGRPMGPALRGAFKH